jgi:hypothetical protein
LYFGKSKISGNFCFERMNLSMFNRFCSSLKARVQQEERANISKANINEERYVIPMHRKNFWTNNWMQEPRKIFCRLQFQHCDPSVQYKRKRGLTLCYNCKRPGHIAKKCPGIGRICLCCKIIGHEFEDCPRMIAKVEQMNMSQENKSILENQKEKGSEKV